MKKGTGCVIAQEPGDTGYDRMPDQAADFTFYPYLCNYPRFFSKEPLRYADFATPVDRAATAAFLLAALLTGTAASDLILSSTL